MTPEEEVIAAGERIGIPKARIKKELRKRPAVPQHLRDSHVMEGSGSVLTMEEVIAMCRRNQERHA